MLAYQISDPILFGHVVNIYFKDVFVIRSKIQDVGLNRLSIPAQSARNHSVVLQMLLAVLGLVACISPSKAKYEEEFKALGVNPNFGLDDLYKLPSLI